MSDSDEVDFPWFYVRMGEFEFQIEGKEEDSIKDVGEEFDNRVSYLVNLAQEFDEEESSGGYQ